MQRVCVFCSSRAALPEAVRRASAALGQWLGHNGIALVYGGVNKGLMEILARHTKEAGGTVIGVIPDQMLQQNLLSRHVDIDFPCVNLNDRKTVMQREADVFIALPGGIGTFDEVFSLLASAKVGEHQKPLVLYNLDNFWDPFVHLLSSLQQQGYVGNDWSNNIHIVNDHESLTHLLRQLLPVSE